MRLRYKRIFLGLLALVLLLLALIVGALMYVTTTTGGLQQLVSVSQRWLPGELQIKSIEGTLHDSLTLQGVSFRNDEGLDISLQRLQLVWEPMALFDGTLHLRTLVLEHPVIILPPAEEQPVPTAPLFPLSLPDVSLPIQIKIDDLQLDQLAFQQLLANPAPAPVSEPEAQPVPVLIEYLVLQAHTEQQTLILDQLEVVAPQGQVKLSGSLLPSEQYPFKLSTEWQVIVPDAPALNGQGTLVGNIAALEITQQLSGFVDMGVSASMALIADTLKLNKLQVTQPSKKSEILLSGKVSGLQTTPLVALDGQWENLGYPLEGDAVYRSEQGNIKLTGSLDDYQLVLNSAIDGADIPVGQWTLNGGGNRSGFTAFELTGRTLEGALEAKGKVTWLPELSWQVALTGQKINPGSEWTDWPAKLDFQLRSSGLLSAQKPLQVQADLVSLSGTLRSEPVKGEASVALNGTELDIRQITLDVASAQLQASGRVGQKMDLDWALNAPTLEKLLPNALGSLTGKGTLRGPQDKLHLVARLQGQGLKFDANQIDDLDADLDIDLSGQQNSRWVLQANNLNLAEQRWKKLTLDGQGTPLQHQTALTLEQGPANLKLSLQGRWEASQWRGSLTRADLQNEMLGSWQLAQPVAIQGSSALASVKDFCWQRQPSGTGELCVDGGWSVAKGSQAELKIRQLALSLLEPFMPAGTQLDGQLLGQASFVQQPGKRPVFSATTRLVKSQVRLESEDLNIIGGDIQFNVSGRQEQIKANLQLPLLQPVGLLHADVLIDDAYQQGILKGDTRLDLSELKFISLFSPQLQAITGKLESALTLTGSIEKPMVRGSLQLVGASAELPALGVKLDVIELEIHDQPGSDNLLLSGALHSGKGALQLSGLLDPLNYSGTLNIAGERFQVMATDEISAWISPALDISVTPELIRLRGEIKIPEAKITPPKIAASATPLSSDVVILDPEGGGSDALLAPQQAMDASLRLTLGDKVEVDALGFKGRLQGSILIEDDGLRATRATGNMDVVAGEYRLYGQDLNIERGSLVFTGGPVDNPGLDLRVSRIVDDVTAGAKVSGTLNEPRLDLFSDPAMPESSLLSYLLFGRAPGAANTSTSEQELLFKAASALTMKGGNVIAEKLTDIFDVNELGLEGDSLNDTSFYIGKYLSPKLYVKYGVGLLEPTSTFLMRYRLSKRWSVESQTGTDSSGGDLIYTLEH
ncbi:translocation/assembly module TamB domain-containing protein [Neptunomonas antarctica]|uniref:Autotransporter secretion inner membrane protein TamB n=1 Tax=Neptunomonas antarctica TaxID=619304 RepID=A0A1N7PBJ2_9GAMM|nr:translocation/assembly module TamB domain-containing protein [Neptunomonas antarctica]SIT07918.1 autotransporter secretion inner membrane protein TamB [Neptunomonas antarctica]